MGTMCGLSKKQRSVKETTLPSLIPKSLEGVPSAHLAKTGEYLISETSSNKKQKRINYWLNLLDKQEVSFAKILNKLKAGPPLKFRWRAWLIALNIKNCSFQAYSQLPLAEAEVLKEIDKDIARAFPCHPYFAEEAYGKHGQGALRRILGKYASQYPEIGYCQGMNYIIGFLLLVSGGSEVEAYYAFERICELFEYKGLFSHDMSELTKETWVFSELLKQKYAAVSKHFTDEMFTEEFWVLKWIITIATMSFSIEATVRIWDNFLVNGRIFLYKLAFALIGKHQSQLLKMNSGELYEFFQSVYETKSIEELIRSADKINISIKTWSEVKSRYRKHPEFVPQLQKLESCKIKEYQDELSGFTYNRRMSSPINFLPSIHSYRKHICISDDSSSDDNSEESNFDVQNMLNKIFCSPSPNLQPIIKSIASKNRNNSFEEMITIIKQLEL